MPIKALENSLWGALLAFLAGLAVLACIGVFLHFSGTRTAGFQWIPSSIGGIWFLILRSLVFITPFILLVYPFWIDERFAVRGTFRFFFYPMVSLFGVLCALVLVGAVLLAVTRLEVALHLPPGHPLPWASAPLPELRLNLSLSLGEAAAPLPVPFFEQLSSRLLAVSAKPVFLGLNPKWWILIFAALYTPLVVWLMRSLPSGRAYQFTAAFASSWTLVAVAYGLFLKL